MEQVLSRIFTRVSEERLKAHLEERYGIGVSGLSPFDVGTYRVERAGGRPWVARLFPAERPVADVEGDAEVLQFLRRQGFPAERCANAEPVTTLEGQAVLVTEFIEGIAATGSPQTFEALGEMLARLHTLPAESGAAARDAGSLHHWAPGGGGPAEDLAAAEAWLVATEDGVTALHRALFETLTDAVATADACHDLPLAFVHPDFILKNVIETPGGALEVIDWAGAGRGPRIASLAFLLWDSARISQDWEGAYVDAILAGYRSHVRLDPDEVARLEDAMRIRPLVFACFQFCVGVSRRGTPSPGANWPEVDADVMRITAYARRVLARGG